MKISSLKEELIKHGNIMFTNKGTSMLPFLREGRDLMVIKKRKDTGRFRKGDAVLFERSNGELVLHRITDVLRDGYLIKGDNCVEKERVREKAVLGVLTEILRDGKKSIKVTNKSYKMLVRAWNSAFPIKKIYMKARGKIQGMKK